MKNIIIGIAGGTGSGKSTFTRKLKKEFKDDVAVLYHDNYYRDQSDIPLEVRKKTNYDHPDAMETELLVQQLMELKEGKAIECPVYDYTLHTRSNQVERVEPKKVILLEGILVLADERLRNLMDIKVYVEADADERILRRLIRDVKERGRDIEGVVEQYLTTVKPMHYLYVEPTRSTADIVINSGMNPIAFELVKKMIKAVFLDMDGTVISHKQGKVLESTKDAICQLRERGIKVFAATGRHILEMEELPVKGISFDGYVMLNGQICLDGEKELVYDFPIAAEDTKRMITVFEEKKIPVMLVGLNRMYINFVDEKVRAAQKAISTAVPKVGSYNGENVYQFIVYDSEGKVQQLMENLTDCKENVWNPMAFDIIPKRGGKAAGIRQILEHFKIGQEEIMAFGDGDNDIDMLRYAHIGVAMGNAGEHVKTHADYVTACVDDDGIYKALKVYGLL